MWQGRLEGLLGRHWPEATRVLKLSVGDLPESFVALRQPAGVGGRSGSRHTLAVLGREVAGRQQDRASLGRGTGEPRRPRGGMGEASEFQDFAQQALQARQQGLRGEGRLRVLARGHGVLEGARPGDRHPDGVCVVGEHGGPAPVSCGGRLSQSHGPEPGRAFQWRIPGSITYQQTGQCSFAATAVLCSLASGAEGGLCVLRTRPENAGSARGQERTGGVDATNWPWRCIRSRCITRSSTPGGCLLRFQQACQRPRSRLGNLWSRRESPTPGGGSVSGWRHRGL